MAARETITAALAGVSLAKLAAHLDSLSGREYIDAYVKLAEFVTPKLQRTVPSANDGMIKVLRAEVVIRSSGVPLGTDEGSDDDDD